MLELYLLLMLLPQDPRSSPNEAIITLDATPSSPGGSTVSFSGGQAPAKNRTSGPMSPGATVAFSGGTPIIRQTSVDKSSAHPLAAAACAASPMGGTCRHCGK